jgi:hypothetical protein
MRRSLIISICCDLAVCIDLAGKILTAQPVPNHMFFRPSIKFFGALPITDETGQEMTIQLWQNQTDLLSLAHIELPCRQ